MDLTLSAQHDATKALAHSEQLGQALSRCRHILQAYPKHAATYGVLGQVYLQLGEHDEAVHLFQRLLGCDPENALAYASLGAVYDARGLTDEAIWQLQRAWELSPANSEIRAELVRMRHERGVSDADRLEPTRGLLARTLMRGQLYGRAIGELQGLLSMSPNRHDLRVALAEAFWHEGLYPQAEAACSRILMELPNCLKANLILGKLWLDGERDEQARVLLQRAQALDPENEMACALFGEQSPLPPRSVRLPIFDKESEEDLPDYLLGSDGEDDVNALASSADAPQEAGPMSEKVLIQARLDYRSGRLDEAAQRYEWLLANGPSYMRGQLRRDLSLCVRLYPNHAALRALATQLES